MNHIYNIIFNRARGIYQVVSEQTKNRAGGQKRLRLLTNTLCIAQLFLLLSAGPVQAATYNVTNNTDADVADTLRGILNGKNGTLADNDIIIIDNSITAISLDNSLPTINTKELNIITDGQSLILTQNRSNRHILEADDATINFGSNITFQKANLSSAIRLGGAISGNGTSTFTFAQHVTFTDNKTTNSGGGISADSGDVTFGSNATFTANTATQYGGGISADSGDVTFGSNATFTANTATQYGGGISADSGDVTFGSDATFTDNKATKSGGGIYADSGDVTFGSDATFDANTSTEYGGGIYAYSGDVTFGSDATFTANTSTQSGGGISAHLGDVTFGDRAVVADNESKWQGGGICAYSGNVTLGDSAAVTGNKATESGGGIYAGSGDVTFGSDATFTDNKATKYGGGIYADSGDITLGDGAVFTGNTASSSSSSFAKGGAIYNGGNLVLSNATFSGNTASSSSSSSDGGAIYNNGGTIALNVDAGNTSLFTGNITNNKGVIAASALYMEGDSTLSVNIAQGGVLDMRDPMGGNADNYHINISQQGAGVWKLGGDNLFTQGSTGKTTFAVNEGTLYLYRKGEIDNANSKNASAKVEAGKIELKGTDSNFTLGSNNADTTLVASGGNAITTEGTIALNTGDGSHNTTLSFGLTGAIAEASPTSANAILNLNADKGLTITGSGKLNIDLQNMAASNGKYTLLYNSSTGDAFSEANVNSTLTLNGQAISYNSRLNNLGLTINTNNLVLTQDHVNGLATWTGAASDGVWDIISGNWGLANENGAAMLGTQYIPGDAVTFSDTGRDQAITVHSGGVTPAGMVVNSAHDYTFSGGEIILTPSSILGAALATGRIEKQGQGTLTFNNQVSGAGHIYGGTMIIGESSANHNAMFTGNIEVYKGTTLGGHGQIAGLVTAQSGAIIAPGNSIGTLSVGDIIFQSGSTYEFEGNPDGSGDKIIASNLLGGGTALINSGANLSILAGAGSWNAATTYSILEADNGVQGQFDHIQTNLAFLTPSLDYSDPNKIGLTLNRNAVGFNHVGRTYNQRNTGLGIQSLSAGHPVYNQIVSMNSEQAQTAFDNLSGEIHASLKSAVLNNSRYTRNAINQHLTQNSGEAPETERNLWVTSWYHKGHLKGDGNAARLDNKGFGIMMGVDALSVGATTLGVALGYEQTEVKLGEGRSSSADMDSTHLLAYGRTKAGPIDIRGAIGYSFLSTESKRHIGVGSLIGTNRADYDGSLIQAYIEGSHTFKATNDIDITPYVNLAYQRVKMDRFTESAGLYGFGSQLNHKGGSSSQTNTTLGVRGQWRINQISDLYADIGWQHTFGSQTPESTFNFMGGQPYRIKGVKTNRNAAVLGLGASFQLTPKMQLSFGYEGHLGDQSRDHSAKLQWRLNF